MSSWGGLDFFIFLILLLNILLGMSRGASREIISMLCLCAALVFTIKFTIPLTNFMNSSSSIADVIQASFVQNFFAAVGMPPLTEQNLYQVNYAIALLICFAFSFSILEGVLSATGFVELYTFPYASLNRKVGAGMGAARGFVLTLIVIIILKHLYAASLDGSYFVNLFQGSAQKFDYIISQQAPERYKEILQDKELYNPENIIGQLQNPT